MKNQVLFIIGVFFLGITGFAQTTYKVGDLAQGGIVFWVDETGQHGLVMALDRIDVDIWGQHSIPARHLRNGVYAGEANTTCITAYEMVANDKIEEQTTAAVACIDYRGKMSPAYGTWYLMSKAEAELLVENLDQVQDAIDAHISYEMIENLFFRIGCILTSSPENVDYQNKIKEANTEKLFALKKQDNGLEFILIDHAEENLSVIPIRRF